MKELTLDNLCRVCLKNSHFHKNIFEVHSLGECLVFELLKEVCDLGISVDDGFPEFLCGECFRKVVEFESFKANAHKGMSSFLLLKERVEHPVIKEEELDINCTSRDESEEPIQEFNSELIIKEEDFDINCNYGDESEEPIEGYHSEMSFGPIILKEEMLTVYGHSHQQEIIESETLVGATELPSTSMEDSTQVTVKSEELIIDSSSYEVSEDPLKEAEVSCGPILLKYEVLPFSRNSHIQEESTDSEVSGNPEKVESTAVLMQDSPHELIEPETLIGATELPSTSMEDSTQQTVDAGSGSDFCEDDSLRGPSFDDDMEPLKLELEEESIDSIEELLGNVIAPEKGVGRCMRRCECDHCKKVFTTKSSIGRHMKDHGYGKPYNPEEEEGEKGTAPEKGIGGRNGIFECHICRKVLMTKKSLKRHLAIHGIGKFLKCDMCGRICVSKSSLIRHIRQHTGERPYKCTDCSKGFSYHGHLNVHMRIHTNVKPFKCKECDKIFNHSSSLKRHMRVHSDVKQYSCEVCHVNFRRKDHVTSHMRTHSGDRPFKSTVCSKAFSHSTNLIKHQFVHSREKPHPCPHCSKRFSLRDNLKTHLRTVCAEK